MIIVVYETITCLPFYRISAIYAFVCAGGKFYLMQKHSLWDVKNRRVDGEMVKWARDKGAYTAGDAGGRFE